MPNIASLPKLLVLPFGLLLLAIALFPVFKPHFWEKNRNKAWVAALFSLPVLLYFVTHGLGAKLGHSLQDYVSFMCLLGSLFIVSGGIVLDGNLSSKPWANTGLLAFGALLANLIGTTGASMLLIRPFLRANRLRKKKHHLPIFFIFLVSNIGGLLTPLGDPPLFLGYLRKVPFLWTLQLLPEWSVMVGSLLLLFFLWDRKAYGAGFEETIISEEAKTEKLGIQGSLNFLFLLGIVGALLLPAPWRELSMLGMTLFSWFTTSRDLRKKNSFTFGPILEVAILFAGIFITMIPALLLLFEHGKNLGLATPAHFFWTTGALSSFLDNAPTYLTFFSVAQGVGGGGPMVAGVPAALLKAISCGAVFMGANSYIGNGPNFMVKAIADEADFKMPKFFGYMGYAILILGPLYLLMTYLFF